MLIFCFYARNCMCLRTNRAHDPVPASIFNKNNYITGGVSDGDRNPGARLAGALPLRLWDDEHRVGT